MQAGLLGVVGGEPGSHMDQTFCVLYPTRGLATPFGGRTQAMAFMERLFAFLNDIHSRSGAGQ